MALQGDTGFKMGEIFKLVGNHIRKALSRNELEITIEQFILLNVINSEEEEELTQSQLAEIMHKDKSGILRITDELEQKKMVVRITDLNDRRKKTLALTKKGLETINTVKKIEADVILGLLAGVTKKELEVFDTVLEKVRKNGNR